MHLAENVCIDIMEKRRMKWNREDGCIRIWR